MIEDGSDFAALRSLVLPAAPEGLRERVRAIPSTPPAITAVRRHRPGTWLLAAALVAVGTLAGALALGGGRTSVPGPESSAPVTVAVAEPTPPPSTHSPLPSPPETVSGLEVMTVSQALAAHRAASIVGPVAVRGFWSRITNGSCGVPIPRASELELMSCIDRTRGITELPERIADIDTFGRLTYGEGPWLTPYIPTGVDRMDALWDNPLKWGLRLPPVPIVAIGHFDDPRAADCAPAARQNCLDRLVVERIVSFDLGSAPSLPPTPAPTPFPFADPPPIPYDISSCGRGEGIESEGWRTLRSLGIEMAYPDEIGYIVVMKPVVNGRWYDDPTDGTRYRMGYQQVCAGWSEVPGGWAGTALPGSWFKEFPDGHREPAPDL